MFKMFVRISACVALALSFFLSSAARAQDVVFTISSVKDFQSKVSAVAGRINPTYPLLVNLGLGQASALGIDMTQPIAVYADLKDNDFAVAVFVPVKSQKLFDASIESLKDKGVIPSDAEVVSQDGYSILLINREWSGSIPKFDTPKTLNLKAKPAAFIPILEQVQLNMSEDESANMEKVKQFLKQMDTFTLTLDASEDGDVEIGFTSKPFAGTEIAENYIHSEQLTKTRLGGFFDPDAPVSAQGLSAFDPNNRRDFVEMLTAITKDIPEDLEGLLDVVLKATDVKKWDFALSFYPDKVGFYGFMAMGIANGDLVNDTIVQAIEKIDPNDPNIQGKANAGQIGEKIKVHELTLSFGDSTKKVAVAVHPKYLFVAVAPIGTSAVTYLNRVFKEKGIEPTKVKKNFVGHFNMEIVAPFIKEVKPNADIDFNGEANATGEFSDGVSNFKIKIDGDLIETSAQIYNVLNGEDEDDDDDDDIFGDDDDDTTEAIAAPGDDDDDDDI